MAGLLGTMGQNALDAYSGSSSGSTLQTFLQKFTSPKGRYVDTLDPLGTFDVKIQFYPADPVKDLDTGIVASLKRLGQSMLNSATEMGENALDNLTGGLFSSLTEGGSITKKKEEFKKAGKHSFMEYLAPANLLQGGEQWQDSKQAASPLILNIGPYVQSITGINLRMGNDQKVQTPLGEFPVNGSCVQPDGALQMEILNTKAALHERIFYPWLRECTLGWWSYDTQPYTTATITIDFTKHNDVKYVFCGCRPSQIKLLEATQQASSGNLTRNVNFLYDFMFVTSDLKVNDSLSDKLVGTATAIASGILQ